ncbi:MAG TPA: MBL fold metallo-hydrolase [Candidatus Coprousia avicola]|nr:MBL fold metallo-hydrolase [Candidatus Coprousia avicola]
MPTGTAPITADAFAPRDDTAVTWLGGAGLLINARGTRLMIDPVLEGFDMPVVFEAPIAPADVPALDAVLITHIDNDHFSRPTCRDLAGACPSYHAPRYVAEVARDEEHLPAIGHAIGDTFAVGCVTARLTPAWHTWQNDSKKWGYRVWQREDYCGYWFDTPDGTIWLPGDSKLLPEQLEMPEPDLILLDFSDNEWHITFEGAVRLANAYPHARLLCIHWGTVDAPDWSTFNGDPRVLADHVDHPERVLAPLPGAAVTL